MFEIIPMTEAHIDDVLAVEEATFSIPWTKQDFEREMKENALAVYFVAKAEDKIIGYAGMWHVITEGHITNVAVLEEYRKQGVGDALMDALEQVAIEREMIGITLEVRMSNRAAQHLYHKHGYRPEGLRKNYYPDTKEDAVIMWKYFHWYEDYDKV